MGTAAPSQTAPNKIIGPSVRPVASRLIARSPDAATAMTPYQPPFRLSGRHVYVSCITRRYKNPNFWVSFRLAAILCRKYRVPSEPRSQAASGGVSTGVGDHFGTLRAASFFFFFLFFLHGGYPSGGYFSEGTYAQVRSKGVSK
jgi:hypothetical protein